LIADVLQFFRGEDGDAQVAYSKGDLGGEDIVTAQHFQPTGFDGQPLPGDYMVLVPGPEAGTFIAIGYLDPKNAGVAREGDLRLYVRDGEGDVQGELHLTQDGEEPDWQATAGALIARADKVDAELEKVKTELEGHEHTYVGGGTGSSAAQTTLNDASYSPSAVGAEKGWVT
jgi:hypothetical protein